MNYNNTKDSIPGIIKRLQSVDTPGYHRLCIGEAIGHLTLLADLLDNGVSNPIEPIQKLRPDFLAGYEAGQKDAKASARLHSGNPLLPPVEGDMLPPIGSRVQIYLNSLSTWVTHTVVGYYVWDSIYHDHKDVHRVFVRVQDAQGFLNARLLSDIRYPEDFE